MEIVVETAPTEEPISLTDAKLFLRVDSGDEDALIQGMIAATRSLCQNEIHRSLLTQTILLTMEDFPDGAIRLYRPPIQSVSSVKYYDSDNALQTLVADTDYMSHVSTNKGSVYLPDGYTWPSSLYDRPDALQVTYIAGWTAADLVPKDLKAWLYMVLGSLYAQKESFSIGTTSTALPGRFMGGLLDGERVYE